jgi:hypothetical protein
MLRSSWVAAQLAASQEGLSSMELCLYSYSRWLELNCPVYWNDAWFPRNKPDELISQELRVFLCEVFPCVTSIIWIILNIRSFCEIFCSLFTRRGPRINHAITYRLKRNLAGTYLGRCAGNWVAEDAEIGFLSPGETDWHGAQRSPGTWAAILAGRIEGNCTNRADRHRSVLQSTVLSSLFLIPRYIYILIWRVLGVNHRVEVIFICPCRTKQHFFHIISSISARGSVVDWGTTLQDGRSRVWFPMRSLHFSIGLILPAALWPWSRHGL